MHGYTLATVYAHCFFLREYIVLQNQNDFGKGCAWMNGQHFLFDKHRLIYVIFSPPILATWEKLHSPNIISLQLPLQNPSPLSILCTKVHHNMLYIYFVKTNKLWAFSPFKCKNSLLYLNNTTFGLPYNYHTHAHT